MPPPTRPTPEAQAAMREGQQQCAARQYDVALAAFERAHALAPSDPEPLHGLGRVYVELFSLSLAEQSFRKALALDPNFVPALADLGKVLGATGHARESVPLLERAQVREPGNLSIRLLLGQSLLWDSQPERAIEALEGGLQLPGAIRDPTLFTLLGQAHVQAGHDEPARQALEKALQLDPRSTKPHFWLSQLLMKTGHEPEGRQESAIYTARRELDDRIWELSRQLAKQPDDVGLLVALAQANLDRGFPERAVTPLRRALSLAPQDPAVGELANRVQAAMREAATRDAGR
jgi:Flp pilus assembly protein TadD